MTASPAADRLTGRTAWARNLAAPIRDFLATETGGAAVLLCAAVAALVWANAPWPGGYEQVWTTPLSIRLGGAGISMDLRHWVNDGLMTLFFLVIGLEAKRELDLGQLRDRRRALLPAIAALGGMAVPILIYLAINGGGDGAHGWGAAMSTDTAFALGILALAAPGGTRIRVRMLAVAVVDDLVALAVIATAYTEHLALTPLLVAAGLFAALIALRFAPATWRGPAALALGVGVWVALHESGIDPVVAGLAVGLVTSAYPPARADLEAATRVTRSFREQPTPALARSVQRSVAATISPNERLQHRLHPWTSYVVVPLFALANAGVHVDGAVLGRAATSPITLGIVGGYVVGKPVGITGATWLSVRLSRERLQPSLTWPAIGGAGVVAGIGFTVSLLISSIAFTGARLEEAKVGVLAAALLASLAGWGVFRAIARLPAALLARQLSHTAEDLIDLAEDVDPTRDHIRGSNDAAVTLVEYGDYECPYCGRAEIVVRELLQSFGDDLRYVWRHLPLNDVHPNTQLAAEAAEAAAEQGRFWEMHDVLLANQDRLTPADLEQHAADIGLDVDRFREDLRRGRESDRVARDVESADASGVAGTPSFFINGRRHEGAYDLETLTAAVGAARKRTLALRDAA